MSCKIKSATKRIREMRDVAEVEDDDEEEEDRALG
jgi:hypothetical protein